MITYEYPFNERIRTLLRLEDLFDKHSHYVGQDTVFDHHASIIVLFEIAEVASRPELKLDLIQELERQRQTLISFRNNPDISECALDEALEEIEQASSGLLAMTGKIGQYLRENEWLMSIKSRIAIPGGVCEFDLPAYHYWLNQDPALRREALATLTKPLLPIYHGLIIVLRLLRASGQPETEEAKDGSFQRMLSGHTAQMVRVQLARNEICYPEISANKYAVNIRFFCSDGNLRPRRYDQQISFKLTFCNL